MMSHTRSRGAEIPLLALILTIVVYHHLAVTTAVLAVFMPFATPSPKMISPKMTPRMGPGNTMTDRYPIAIRPGVMRMTPLAASNPATGNDLCLHDTKNAAVASR